jgi:ATP-dependent Clp protease ATP-binding subunit ClpC
MLLPTAGRTLRLGHDFIGTEHLMLGILRDGNGKEAIQI